MANSYRAGIDIGSTTVKVAVYDETETLVFKAYHRHHNQAEAVLASILADLREKLGSLAIKPVFTGSAGIEFADRTDLPFSQEVVASAAFLQKQHPDVRTFIEIGGEDAKIVFFDDELRPQIRMNGSCAGGTGAFIEQMSLFLNTPLEAFNALAERGSTIYPIASRCGVFAKTDVQSLLSNFVAKEDIAASIFHAVALQILASLGRGNEIRGKLLFAGGPLAFFPALREAFIRVLNLDREKDIVSCSHPELIAATGAVCCPDDLLRIISLEELESRISRKSPSVRQAEQPTLRSLFGDAEEREAWEARHRLNTLPRRTIEDTGDSPCFLGIDSGSTTTKIVLIDEEKRIILDDYRENGGDPLLAVRKGLDNLMTQCHRTGRMPFIARAAVTGYGEELVKAAYAIHDGIVETLAHFRAAQSFVPEISFLLDIGGQDMKAIYVRDGVVADVQINEACSSGCGSFLETFARALGYDPRSFAELACQQTRPFDLGTRCTVFMNSRVRQALREGATVADISAGLAYAVIRNTLYKVLKLKDDSLLGNHIVVQGGTFCNPAVLRAFELLLGREVVRPDMAAMMGAYGAALTALHNYRQQENTPVSGWDAGKIRSVVKSSSLVCSGCENSCNINKLTFDTGKSCVFGNRCERNAIGSSPVKPGVNLINRKLELLFDRPRAPEGRPLLTFGIPRVLNMYENFPFWCTFLVACGFRVVLSPVSGAKLFEKGVSTVMSDNICFPAKLVHGHIVDLATSEVDRIFYPTVVFEQQEFSKSLSSFNCPIVTGYPDVIRSALNPEGKYNLPLDTPVISFQNPDLLKKQLYAFFKPFGVGKNTLHRATELAITAQADYKRRLQEETSALVQEGAGDGALMFVLAGRPYHADPLVNHGIPELISRLGLHVIPEDGLALNQEENLFASGILPQWAYTNHTIAAARFTASSAISGMIQLTSFGCGLDALAVDEVKEIVTDAGKGYSLIKIDEVVNISAARIRIRALVESLKEKRQKRHEQRQRPISSSTPIFCDRSKTILVPWFSPYYSPFLPSLFQDLGYRLVLLPPQDKASVDTGLRHVNNDMCYPAVILIGDVIKALQTGNHSPADTAIMFTQTFGQCRASSYVPLMRKALTAAGFGEVRVFSIAAEEKGIQFALDVDTKQLIKRLSLGLMFNDALTSLYLATMAHEVTKGESLALQHQVMAEITAAIPRGAFPPLLKILGEAVSAYNGILVDDRPLPVIGLVGEIFVKYNPFSNLDMVQWLVNQGVEVTLPSLVNFFTQCFVNVSFNQEAYLARSLKNKATSLLLSAYAHHYLRQVEEVRRHFRYYRKSYNIRELGAAAASVTSLANQAGEGWLLNAEMIAMARNGIEDIICLQPFGCLANHITGKGAEKRMKSLYPRLNLHFLDMDAGTSEVNIINRLFILLETVRSRQDKPLTTAA